MPDASTATSRPFPVTVAIADRVADLPAVQRVAPDTQPDKF